MVSFQDLQKMSFEQAKDYFPLLQYDPFLMLRDLNRARFIYEWRHEKKEHPKLGFNLVATDEQTRYSTKHMMLVLMERGHFIFTEDDIDCAYAGMKLFFITDMGLRQGLMKEVIEPDGSVDYEMVENVLRRKVRTHFRVQSPQIPQARFKIKTSTIIEP